MTKAILRPLVIVMLGAMLLQSVPVAEAGPQAMYLCINNDNGTKDKLIGLYPMNSTVSVKEFPGDTFSVAAQFGSDNTVRWIYYHRGVMASGSVKYLLNLSTNTLFTHLVATTAIGTKVNSQMQWFCRKMS